MVEDDQVSARPRDQPVTPKVLHAPADVNRGQAHRIGQFQLGERYEIRTSGVPIAKAVQALGHLANEVRKLFDGLPLTDVEKPLTQHGGVDQHRLQQRLADIRIAFHDRHQIARGDHRDFGISQQSNVVIALVAKDVLRIAQVAWQQIPKNLALSVGEVLVAKCHAFHDQEYEAGPTPLFDERLLGRELLAISRHTFKRPFFIVREGDEFVEFSNERIDPRRRCVPTGVIDGNQLPFG